MPAGDGGATIGGRYALVVSASAVNTVVVAGIIRDCGIKAIATPPAGFLQIVETARPLFMVIDCHQQADGVAPLVSWLSEQRTAGAAPPAVLVAGDNDGDLFDYPFMAVAAMPVTMEKLRPLIERCLSQAQE